VILLQVDDRVVKAATERAVNSGWPDLDTRIRDWLFRYATGQDASAGGRKRAANMTDEQRKDAARHAARARWHGVPGQASAPGNGQHASRRALLKLARRVVSNAPRRMVPGWPLEDREGED
jgi:hypothetical protein